MKQAVVKHICMLGVFSILYCIQSMLFDIGDSKETVSFLFVSILLGWLVSLYVDVFNKELQAYLDEKKPNVFWCRHKDIRNFTVLISSVIFTGILAIMEVIVGSIFVIYFIENIN